jgi:hypothetical protein
MIITRKIEFVDSEMEVISDDTKSGLVMTLKVEGKSVAFELTKDNVNELKKAISLAMYEKVNSLEKEPLPTYRRK